jgi:hypothetical protein
MKNLGLLKHESGWSGGRWTLNGKDLNRADLPSEVILEFGRKKLKAKVVETKGTDHDHGHDYSWTNFDFKIKMKTDAGVVSVNLLDNLGIGRKKISLCIES